jgi:hypothetical protein
MKRWLVYPLAASTVTVILHFVFSLPIGFSALIAFLVWPIVGTLLTADDDLPGGWSNPDGSAIPEWERWGFWARLAGGCAVTSLAFEVQIHFSGQPSFFLALLGLTSVAASVYLFYRAHQKEL